MDIKDWAIDKLSPIGLPAAPTALDATFCVAARMAVLGVAPSLGEEANTSAFLGGLFATFPWAVGAFGAAGSCPVSWSGYRKGGRQGDSESVTGADFALVVHLPEGRVRVALFQAKRVKRMVVTSQHAAATSPNLVFGNNKKSVTVSCIDLHHAVGTTASRQFIQFYDHGLALLSHAVSAGATVKPGMKGVDWLHYLAYDTQSSWCVAMSELRKFMTWYTAVNHSALVYPRGSANETVLLDLLLQGSAPETVTAKGWLTLDAPAAMALLGELAEDVPVYATDALANGPVPDFFPGVKRFVRIRAAPRPAPKLVPKSKRTAKKTARRWP